MSQKKHNTNTNSIGYMVSEIIKEIIMLLIEALKELLKFILKKIAAKMFDQEDDKLISKKDVLNKKTTIRDNSIGWSSSHKREITFKDFQDGHTVVLGSTGTGKTNFFYLLMDNAVASNETLMWFDPKSSKESISNFISINKYYKKESIIFSETSHANAKFNPLKSLNDSQILTLIINSFEWSDGEARYYKDRTIELLGTKVLPTIRKEKGIISLHSIYRMIDERFDCKEVSGFMAQLTIIIKSPFGHLFNDDDNTAITMSDIIESKKALYVGVSAQGYGSIARSIAKVLLSELQIRSHELGIKYEDSESAKLNPIYLIIDEAEALLYKEFINLLNKGRSSGFKITLGTQTYSDFDTISKDFTRQIKTNCSNMFVFNLGNDKDGYEDVSKSIGTLEDIKITKSTENGEATERGSERDVLRYIAHPQVLKHLPKGTCIYVRKFPFKTFALNIKDSKTLKSLATRSNRHIRRPINDDINPRIIAESKKENLIKVALENSEEFNTNNN